MSSRIQVSIDDLEDGTIVALLNDHLKEMHKYSPAESIHAVDPGLLRQASVTFWGARINGALVGCGALKEMSAASGELKSMKTATAYLRRGVATTLLHAILYEASQRNYSEVKLETGTHQAFVPAVEMYKRHGFVECGPFGDYKPDPYSRFFTKTMAKG